MARMTQAERDTLEALVDRYSLEEVVEGLAQVAHEKASHLLANWQDKEAFRRWGRGGTRLARFAATKLKELGI